MPLRIHLLFLLTPVLVLADPTAPRLDKVRTDGDPRAIAALDGPLPARFQRGIAYAHSWRGGGYGTATSAQTLWELRKMNVRWVSLTPFGYMASPDSTRVQTIHNRPGHETDRAMALDIAEARRLGMRVLLKPHIWIDHGSWPGDIDFEDPVRFSVWLESYGRMILRYAEFAESNGVEALSIGCEFKRLTPKYEHQWRELIARIRGRYSGRLVYSANWDEYDSIPWWDALDAVGVNAYFPLCESERPTMETLMAGASAVRGRLERFHERVGRPIIFTEIGYGSVSGAAARPWEADRTAPVNVEIQRLCYEAIVRTFSDARWLEGVYWWKWFSAASARPDGYDHDPFSPRNKPAEDVIEAWYGGEAPT